MESALRLKLVSGPAGALKELDQAAERLGYYLEAQKKHGEDVHLLEKMFRGMHDHIKTSGAIDQKDVCESLVKVDRSKVAIVDCMDFPKGR